jgi:hypothetical protein
MINKGVIQPDKSYQYTCRQCAGRGMVHGQPCAHCYGLDVDRLCVELKLARGERYYALLKAYLSVRGKAIVDDAQGIRARAGKLTPFDVAWLSAKYDLNFKAIFEWLEETNVCAAGTHYHVRETMRRQKVTVAAFVEKARAQFGGSELK